MTVGGGTLPGTQHRGIELVPERLELGEELGVGAVATVYRARDSSTGEQVALKLLHDRNARDPRAARRFEREVELARTLVDPHIVAVFGAIELDGRQALVMELVEGPTLADLIARDAPLEQARLIAIARAIAQGLSVAHAGGVIHRDLKPANVLIAHADEPGEQPKIADFGMARAASFAGVDREAMVVLGTPDYMAPECIDPLAVDPRADLYALGCIIIEMATGRPPFAAPTPFAVLAAQREREPPSLPDHYAPQLRELTAALLAKRPSDRPHAASAVVDWLDRISAGEQPTHAMVPTRASGVVLAAAAAGRCARCGAPVLHGVRLCLECGLVRVKVEPGKWSVFVTGPGLVGDKFDSSRRDALLHWLRNNPDAGLDARELVQRIPRLPFPLVTGVSQPSAQSMVESLGQLGIMADCQRGGRLSHELMRDKVFRIGARRGRVALPLLLAGLPLVLLMLVVVLPLLPIYFGVVAWWTSQPALRLGQAETLALPPMLSERLQELERRAEHVGPRHRAGLRAVVQRVMALVEATPSSARAEIDAEMAHAIAVATVASERMTDLDALVSSPAFDASEPEHRRDLQERDMWSARMLELAATLDSLVARSIAARSALRAADHHDDDQLEQLRADIEALEEVRALGERE